MYMIYGQTYNPLTEASAFVETLTEASELYEAVKDKFDFVNVINQQEELTPEQHYSLLVALRDRIASGVPLQAWNDNTVGDRDQYTNWGCCCDDKELWPIETHKWPLNEQRGNRVYGLVHHGKCPFDRLPEPNVWSGCWHRCVLYHTRQKPTAEQALEWFDEALGC